LYYCWFLLVIRSNAYAVALFLESHPAVRRVLYPGLPTHPQHELAKRQQHGFGSMITFYVQGSRTESATVLQNVRFGSFYFDSFFKQNWGFEIFIIYSDNILPYFVFVGCMYFICKFEMYQLRVFALAESLGAVESLAECPSLMTHASVPDAERSKLGIDDSLIRLSVGIESCQDLIDDLRTALDSVSSLTSHSSTI
jgi:cystathionine gamma-lyase